jgi:tRNA threonylcarbamoyl adenosine modification protein (Sua5/YciO/YrdC/YwlC family)
MPIIQIHPINPQPRLIQKVAQVIDNGGIIAYPSDTSYALAVDIFNKKSVERLYTLKKTDKSHYFSCICYDFAKISEYAFVSTASYRIMNHLLPGRYTFILTGKSALPKLTLSKRKTIGVRMPDAAIPKALFAACKNPFLTCSTKLGEGETLNDPHEINDRIGHQIDLVIDGGDVPYNPSSIISLEDEVPVIVREGSGGLGYFGE